MANVNSRIEEKSMDAKVSARSGKKLAETDVKTSQQRQQRNKELLERTKSCTWRLTEDLVLTESDISLTD